MKLIAIQRRIFEIRGHKVMLDFHLASIYMTETRALKQAVKRNRSRFPPDFMFQLTRKEWKELITNCDNLKWAKFSPSLPFAFTEQGVAMLSSVLNSPRAIQVNISIMRAFVMIRQYHLDYKELKLHIMKIEKDMNKKFKDIYEAINYLLRASVAGPSERKKIGYKRQDEE